MVYSGDISREKSCSGRWLTRRFLPSGLAIRWSRSENLFVVFSQTKPLLAVFNGSYDGKIPVNMRLGYLECDETPSK
jgi:hypothetical protein